MNWYFEILGGHTHVAVYMNGGKCGVLCFRNEEFDEIRAEEPLGITFIHIGAEAVEDLSSAESLRRFENPS